MTKAQNAQPKPAMAKATEEAKSNGGNVESIKTSPGASQTNRPSLMASVRAADQDAINAKITLVTTSKQRLAMAADLYRDGNRNEREAAEAASVASVPLVEAIATGIVSKDEANSILGDVFGYKVKGKAQDGAPPITAGVPSDFSKDGLTASKTPYGDGEAIRKRIMRAVQADQYVNGGEATAFFAGLDEKEVGSILASVKAGKISIWSAYDYFAKLKPRAERVDNAFNPKVIAAIFEKLAEEGGKPAAELFRRSPALIESYAALSEAIAIVDEMAATLNETNPLTKAEAKAVEQEAKAVEPLTPPANAVDAETSDELQEQAA
jgi:hypothetical protein